MGKTTQKEQRKSKQSVEQKHFISELITFPNEVCIFTQEVTTKWRKHYNQWNECCRRISFGKDAESK